MSTKLKKIRASLNKNLRLVAKAEMKTNPKVKLFIKDVRDHFKRKDAWPLGYEVQRDMTRLTWLVFNQVLLLLNMKIYFCNERQSVVFKRNKK